ncbi:DNA repair protein RAD51 homolog 4-like isoform X2 [Uloborus diversus]|uniref:DNA repair protein RAD51 homolog 4-like isoform X2 n=1 Tax=Uloborus diversus TaxID=327109 RepID=UPI0024095DE5|nr:DNA repair protein RAD51 homolog 4-like isoform X2 [Uloborus diversus]
MPRLAEGVCSKLTSAVIARCKTSKIFTVDDFIFQDPESLSKDISTPYKDVLLIRDALLLKFAPVLRRADSLLCEVLDTLAIFETGSKRINNALQGGVYTGEVTEIHGPPGSGKTQFCLDVISNLLIETSCTVLYMDSNCTFSAGRVEEILLQKSDGCTVLNEKLQRIKVINMYDVYNFLDILYYVEKELQKKENFYYKNLKLVIIDSITHILAPCFGGSFLDGGGMISIVSELFNIICSKYTLSIMGLFKDVPFCIGKCGISN